MAMVMVTLSDPVHTSSRVRHGVLKITEAVCSRQERERIHIIFSHLELG